MSATPFPSRFMGAKGYGGKRGVKGRGRSPPGEPERRTRESVAAARTALTRCGSVQPCATEPEKNRCGSGFPSPRGVGESPLGDEPRRLGRRCLRSALPGERLEPVGDDLDSPSSAAVGGLPLAALEPTLDVDEAPLAEVLAGEVSKLAPEDHIVEVGVALAVRGDPDGRDVLAGCGLPQVRSCDEAPDEGHLVHRVSPALDGSGLLLRGGCLAAHCCTSCYVDRCHGDKRVDCRAE